MYKVSYYLSGGTYKEKSFETLHEATVFANKQPIETVIQIKIHYDQLKKPNRS